MRDTAATTVLYRPVGPNELRLIETSGFREFPPRLPEQPIFYPVLTEEYATQIARDWNAKGPRQREGYVTRFKVRNDFLQKYEVRRVGGMAHREYWMPADQIAEFNGNIGGLIEVVADFRVET